MRTHGGWVKPAPLKLVLLLGVAWGLGGCVEDQGDPPIANPEAGVMIDGSIVEPDGGTADDGTPDAPDGDAPACPEGLDGCGVCGGPGPQAWYADTDGDGRGDDAIRVEACDAPAGFVAEGGDPEPSCATDDTDACGVCAGPGEGTWYADLDGDGRGDPAAPVTGCVQPAGTVEAGDDPEPDCATDDTDVCGVCAGPGEQPWYEDADEDGLGDPAAMAEGCAAPMGFVANFADPEPACATNDTDECDVCAGPGAEAWYADTDGDGLGDPLRGMLLCVAPGEGFSRTSDDPEPDCATNDTDACGVCAGPGPQPYYADVDGDGRGDPRARVEACAAPEGFVDNDADADPECATNDSHRCGGCGGGGRFDCAGTCEGEAVLDACGLCVGGETGREPTAPGALCPQCDRNGLGRMIVQFTEIPRYDADDGGPYTFQVVLYENGDFEFLYQTLDPFAESATVGWQGDGGRDAVQLGHHDDFPRRTRAVSVRRQPDGRLVVDDAPAFEWVDIRHAGDPLILEDDNSIATALGFQFPFDGRSFDEVRVASNGVISFDGRFSAYSDEPLPAGELGAFLAPLWDDLNPTAGGSVTAYFEPVNCDIDCTGTRGGTAFLDSCGVCASGSTGVEPDAALDCAGVCGGEAYIDECGACVGGDTGLEPTPPEQCATGPDLIVDRPYLRDTLALEYLNVFDECLVNERCVRDVGRRKILRFGTRIANIGTEDLRLGRPSDDNPAWTYDECHEHYHFDAYAAYDLYDVAADEVLPIGAKTGFSVIDIGVYDPAIAVDGCRGYNARDQGITAGCQDTYGRHLQCQWIDITDVPDGEYDVIVTTNPDGDIDELSLDNNDARVRVRINGDDLEFVP